MAAGRKWRSYQHNFNRAHDVHSRRQRGARIEQHADGAAEFRAERARDHKVAPAARHHAVRRNRRHRDGRQHRHTAAHQHDEEALHGASGAHHPRQSNEEDYAEDVLNTREVNADEGAHISAAAGGPCVGVSRRR